MTIAFGTANSEAALPRAMEAMEAIGVPRQIVAFVIPTGYSFNLTGSSLYLSVAAIFVAQVSGIHLTLGQQLMIMLTLMLTSKGVAGVSRAALVILLATASSTGLADRAGVPAAWGRSIARHGTHRRERPGQLPGCRSDGEVGGRVPDGNAFPGCGRRVTVERSRQFGSGFFSLQLAKRRPRKMLERLFMSPKKPAGAHQPGHEFRLRSHEISRIEAFSDVVFGFSLTLLVVSLEVPRTYSELIADMRGFVPFAVCFALLAQVWWLHHNFFRRYGLEDATTATLNFVLLFVVLFYTYPLKFVFSGLFDQITGHTLVHEAGGKTLQWVQPEQAPRLMVIYGIGYAAVFLIFVLAICARLAQAGAA